MTDEEILDRLATLVADLLNTEPWSYLLQESNIAREILGWAENREQDN